MTNPSKNLLDYIHFMVGVCRDDPREDTQLLAQFVENRDERAFTILLGRHGPLVWRTCTRVLGDGPDAEDAFQAAFITLARKASQLRGDTLAGWLHRVARQTAVKADNKVHSQRRLEQRLRAVAQSTTAGDTDRAELYAALDEELAELPERLRVPLVLRYLEGKTLAEVARILGCSLTPVTKCLARGEAILRQRLKRRGIAVGVGSVAVLLGGTTGAPAVSARLMDSTARAALRSLSLAPLESSEAVALAEGVIKAMVVTKTKLATVLLGLTLCLAGGGLLAYQALAGNTAEPPQLASEPGGEAEASHQSGVAARVDCYGDPLPAGVLARMGTTRLWRREGWYRDSNAFAFSPDGKTLATHINGMTVCLWDAVSGKEIRRLTTEAFKGHIVSLGFSPDGKMLVTMNGDLTVGWWEVATGKFLRKQEYQGPKRDDVRFGGVAFLPDGKMLGFADFLKAVEQKRRVRGAYVWDVATGKEICRLSRPLKEGEGGRGNTAISPDGKMLTTVVNENVNKAKATISLWDAATGREIRQLTYEDGLVNMVAFSRDGKTLASAANDGAICVWEAATGKKIHLFEVEGTHDGPLTFSPDGKTLVGGEEGHLWNVNTGKEIRSFGWRNARVALFSPDGKILAVGDQAGAIRLWEIATGKEIGPRRGCQGSIRSAAYSPDSNMLVSGSEGGALHLWEVATGKEIRQLTTEITRDIKVIDSVAYSPDGKVLVSVDNEAVHLWDTVTGVETRCFGKNTQPKSAVFSPDSKILAAILRYDQMVCLWEVATGKEIFSRPAKSSDYTGSSMSLAFSPDGRLLAAPGNDNTVSLWEAATGKLIGRLGGLKQPAQRHADKFVVWSLAFSAGGRMLATSSRGGREDEKVHVWEVATGKEICQLDGLKGVAWGCTLAFSPDGRVLATAAQGRDGNGHFDPKVHLWEIASGKEIGRLTGHQAPVQTLAFSPDGKTLASGSEDLTCLVWDLTAVGRLKPVPTPPLSKERLEAAWTDLAKDPAKAYAAIWVLQAAPVQAVSLLQARVRPVAPADPQQLKRWIADLNDNSFVVRDKAQRKIEKLGEVALPALRKALKGQPALELQRRLQALLAESEPNGVGVSPRGLREFRAVQVLESIGTAEARQMLQAWAKGVPEARLTREAEAALTRLTKCSAARP